MPHEKGMTLIEVLLALAIVAIALTAVMQAAALSVRQSFYLQQRTLATWAGLEIIHQMEAGLRAPPEGGGTLHGESRQGGQRFSWEVSRHNTPTKGITTLQIQVFPGTTEDHPLTRLTGFLYVPRN